ncbi:MAG TPA: hypothetical protein DHN29_15995 [Cytophagales bacterium]|nr:hypothetical protein [Cytophagales bacterium]|tara:strand:+ start:2763 stop:3194 length:432 start_codon:yes stop_codon:yes gene_type:complete
MFIELTNKRRKNTQELYNTDFLRKIERREDGAMADYMGKAVDVAETYEDIRDMVAPQLKTYKTMGNVGVQEKPVPKAATVPTPTPKKKRGRPSKAEKIAADAERARLKKLQEDTPSVPTEAPVYEMMVHVPGSEDLSTLEDDE